MADVHKTVRCVQVRIVLAFLVPLLTVLIGLWALALAYDRNPLPSPDRDYQVFSASSAEGKKTGGRGTWALRAWRRT